MTPEMVTWQTQVAFNLVLNSTEPYELENENFKVTDPQSRLGGWDPIHMWHPTSPRRPRSHRGSKARCPPATLATHPQPTQATGCSQACRPMVLALKQMPTPRPVPRQPQPQEGRGRTSRGCTAPCRTAHLDVSANCVVSGPWAQEACSPTIGSSSFCCGRTRAGHSCRARRCLVTQSCT